MQLVEIDLAITTCHPCGRLLSFTDASREGALYQSYDAYAGAQGFYEPGPEYGDQQQQQQQQQPPVQDAFAQVCML
jgi:hypothetical protein